MRKRIIWVAELICLFGLVLWVLGYEYNYFSHAWERCQLQYTVDPYVRHILNEHNELSIHQLSYRTLMFKFDNGFPVEKMEQVVMEFEDYCKSHQRANQVDHIVFLDDGVTDILIPGRGDCVIEFVRDDDLFGVINIYDANPEKYPMYYEFASYQNLSRDYYFDVNTDLSFGEPFDPSVINSIYLNPIFTYENSQVLNQMGVDISEEYLEDVDY